MAERKSDRMALNAAIEYLISEREDGWLEAAQQVIDFGLTIASLNGPIVETVSSSPKKDEKVRGYAAGIGNIEIDDQSEKSKTYRINSEVGRIGSYRLIHFGRGSRIKIQHFQQVPPFRLLLAREDFEPDGYELVYAENHTPLIFVAIESRIVPKRPEVRELLLSAILEYWQYVKCLLTSERYVSGLRIWLRYEHRYKVIHSTLATIPEGYVSEIFP